MITAGVLLAAGVGARMHPLTEAHAKPLLPVVGRPLLGHALDTLVRLEVDRVVANTHHCADEVAAFLSTAAGTVAVEDVFESQLSGPAGALVALEPALDGADTLIVHSGDVVTSDPLDGLLERHRAVGAALTFGVWRTTHARRYGVLDTDHGGSVRGSREKPDVSDHAEYLVSAGIYCLDRSVLSVVRDLLAEHGAVDYARELAPELIRRGRAVATHPLSGYWRDVGTPESLLQVNLDGVRARIGERHAAGRRLWRNRVGNDVEVYVDPYAHLGADVDFDGPSVVCGDTTIGAGSAVTTSLLLPGSRVPNGALLCGGVFGGVDDRRMRGRG